MLSIQVLLATQSIQGGWSVVSLASRRKDEGMLSKDEDKKRNQEK